MSHTRQCSSIGNTPESFLECLQYFLTPRLWRQAHQAMRRPREPRWRPKPLLFVLLVMTWSLGDSLPERFETARAFYTACYQRRRRPGKTFVGWQKALTRTPASALRLVAAILRRRLLQVFAKRWLVDGFVPIGCDGSGLQCPRSQELEEQLRHRSRKRKRRGRKPRNGPRAPHLWATTTVHLGLGLLWSWRLGTGTADEREHLVQLLPTLPERTLLIADAGFIGYDLLKTLVDKNISFLIRLCSKAPLYSHKRINRERFREDVFDYWPQKQQNKMQQPIRVRVLRIGRSSKSVWLMTNVFDAEQLPLVSASRFYRWRWRHEGLFRTYKRTLGKVKLMGRTVKTVHREAEGSLLAVQLLLAHGALAVSKTASATMANAPPELPSARAVLIEIRAEIRHVTAAYLGRRQWRTYLERLQRVRRDRRRKRRRNKIRRRWPSRVTYKPPKPPRILKMGTLLKRRAEQLLGLAATG
jgi:hypothetical protein